MNKVMLVVFLLLTSGSVYGQSPADVSRKRVADSIKSVYIDEAALKYPRIRQFTLTHQQGLTGNIHAKYYGNDLFKGRFQGARTTINMNMPIMEMGKGTLVTSIGVVHQFFNIGSIESYNTQHPVRDTNTYMPMISLGVSYIRHDSLLGRRITTTASLYGLFNPSFSRRQFSFIALVMMPVVQTKTSNLTVGMLLSIDPSSPIPASPLISYSHHFTAWNMDLMADLPYRAALRKPVTKKISVTAFGELAGNNSFFNLPASYLPTNLTYATFEVKTGVLLEYRLTKKTIFSISGGSLSTATSKIFEQGKKPGDYLIKNSNSTVPYVQVGLSLLPFWKGLNL